MNRQLKPSSIPFHTIVVTSPDAKSAEAALSGVLHPSSLPTMFTNNDGGCNDINIYSTSDPFNTRMGSGGGTLAALDVADTNNNDEDNTSNGSVLIIHAGGQSSRCPTQITLGKAWTSLPIENDVITNPTYLLMESLSKVLADLPSGSVVVAASDVLLSLPMSSPINFDQFHQENKDEKVLGLAVPAPLETAKNHGVFVVDDENIINESKINTSSRIKPIHAFLQKPTVKDMKEFESGTCVLQNGPSEMAWIDTGVIIFLPKAAKTLRAMMKEELSICTRTGLQRLFQCQTKQDTILHDNIVEFAKDISVRVELYSHLLLAIPTKGSLNGIDEKQRLEDYLSDSANKDLNYDLLTFIFNRFAKFELQVCLVPDGDFFHLGTTTELRDFMINGSTSSLNSDTSFDEKRYHNFGKRIGLVQQSNVIVNDITLHQSSSVLNSIMIQLTNGDIQSSVGSGTVIEHCELIDPFSIGSNCLVSGLRGRWSPIVVPDNFVCQLIKLRSDWREFMNVPVDDGESFVCIFYHIDDDIKAHNTCYGVPFKKLFQVPTLSYSDLWESHDKKQLLWNAKIHPIITKSSNGDFDWSIFNWIQQIEKSSSDKTTLRSLQNWKHAYRLSLSELRIVADASTEFTYREKCRTCIHASKKIQSSLLNRSDEEIFLDSITMSYIGFISSLKILDKVVMTSLNEGSIDICSRAFMLMGKIIFEFAENFQEDSLLRARTVVEKDFDVADYLIKFKDVATCADKESKIRACNQIIHHRDAVLLRFLSKGALTIFASALEEVSYFFTQSCVSSYTFASKIKSQPIVGTWVVANAPARIDLSGGWSDTPPISYEHGGAVACLAVTINNRKPLSARSRIVEGGSGILLCVENRDITTGKLTFTDKVNVNFVQDLSDFSDPSAICALAKCALLVCGLISIEMLSFTRDKPGISLQPYIDNICQSSGIGLELVTTSFLPQGSGMGSSSILAGCMLVSLSKCLGLSFDDEDDDDYSDGLTRAVLLLEQLLSTGGGWQDQVGGLHGGLKLGLSERNRVPIRVEVKQINIQDEIIAELNERMVLIYTGQPRLARNILRNVLRRWVSRRQEIMNTINNLVEEANEVAKALNNGDIDSIGPLLRQYWSNKKTMAGPESGVEPLIVGEIIDILHERDVIIGATLCGAGGGGFLFVLTKGGMSKNDVKECINQNTQKFKSCVGSISFYDCKVCLDGVNISTTATDDIFEVPQSPPKNP